MPKFVGMDNLVEVWAGTHTDGKLARHLGRQYSGIVQDTIFLTNKLQRCDLEAGGRLCAPSSLPKTASTTIPVAG